MENYLMHYGVKGQKWGVRRFKDDDGTLTKDGRKQLRHLIKKEIKREKGKKVAKKVLAVSGGIGVAAALVYAHKNLNSTSFVDGKPKFLQAIIGAPLMAKALINK